MSTTVGASPTGAATVQFEARSDERATAPLTTADPTREPSFDAALDRAGHADRARPSRVDRDARDARRPAERAEGTANDEKRSPRRANRSEKKPARECDRSADSPDDADADATASPAAANGSVIAAQVVACPTTPAKGSGANGVENGTDGVAAAVAAVGAPGTQSQAAAGAAPDAEFDLSILGGLALGKQKTAGPAVGKTDSAVEKAAEETAPSAAGTTVSASAAADSGGQPATPAAAVGTSSAPGGLPNAAIGSTPAAASADASHQVTDTAPVKSIADARAGEASARVGTAADESPAKMSVDSRPNEETRPADGSEARRPDEVVGARFDPATAQVVDAGRSGASDSIRSETRLTGAERRHAVDQILDRAQLFSTAGGRGATLRLDPPELGMLNVRVVVESGQVSLHIATETTQARDIIQAGWSKLQEGFAERGLRVEHLVVEQTSAGNGAGLAFGSMNQGGGYGWGRQNGAPEASFASARSRSRDVSGQVRPDIGPASGGRGALIDVRV